MRFWYDTEFLEDGRTIDLISIGIVAEDGREYYAVSDRAADEQLNRRIRDHDWLMANVVPSLPRPQAGYEEWLFDYMAPEVKPRSLIAQEVRDFILGPPESDDLPYVELWADYGAYDHVALCQLWGPMIALPEGMPMFTSDIQQEAARRSVSWKALPQQQSGQHNALSDARHCRARWEFLNSRG